MKIPPRQWAYALGLFVSLAVLFGFHADVQPEVVAAPGAVDPLDRVGSDSAVLIHGRAAVLWAHPLVTDLRKQYAKPLEKVFAELQKNIGMTPDQLETVTFSYPKMPAGPGDESLFIVQVVTKAPYDKAKLLVAQRAPKAEVKNDLVALTGSQRLHFTSATQFTLLHESLVADFLKGPAKSADGPLAGAIKAAKDPANTLTLGVDPSGLPNEIFTAAPPELQPFLPLLKSKNILFAATTEKGIGLKVRFTAENGDKAIDAERSLSLLKKLAETSLADNLEEKKLPEELKAMLPALKELHESVKASQIVRKDVETSAAMAIDLKAELLKPVIGMFLGVQNASSRAQSANNLKQMALAIHNYHDTYGISPPAAICDKKGKPLLSWRVAILPFIEGDELYKKFKLDEPWDSEHNKKLIDQMPRVYAYPYDETPSKNETHYQVFVGGGALFDTVQGFKFSGIPDGTSNTLLFVEAAKSVPWTKPEDIEYDAKKPVSPLLAFQRDVCQVAFADGSVRAITKKLEEKIWHWLIQPNDGNAIGNLND